MLRILMYSPDVKMHSLLASALRPDCLIAAESSPENLKRAAAGGQAPVIVLDLDSNYFSLAQQIALYESIADCAWIAP